MAGYPAMPQWYHQAPPSVSAPSAVAEERKQGERDAIIVLLQKQEDARIARETEMIKRAEADAAATAAAKAKEEEEKRKKEEIAAASKKAKEDAEKAAEEKAKKLKEESDKKLKEAEAAKVEAEKKRKEAEEEAAKLKPADQACIKFKDAVGRKFNFPFAMCKTWKGTEHLIKQAFAHVDLIGEQVQRGHYDLMGSDGEIILPQVWESVIQPDWEISMHMWPIEEKKDDKLAHDMAALVNPFADIGIGGKPKKKGSTKDKKKGAEHIIEIPPPPPRLQAWPCHQE